MKKALSKVLPEIKENTKTKKLTRDDIELIAFQSGIPAKEVWYYLKANECEDNSGINAEMFYGLFKSGKKTNLNVLSSLNAEETESLLKRAAEKNFISDRIAGKANTYIEKWKTHRGDKLLNKKIGDTGSSLSVILGIVIGSESVQKKVVKSYIESDREEFWNNLPQTVGNETKAKKINIAIRLGTLTGMQKQMTNSLLKKAGRSEPEAYFKKISRWNKTDWISYISEISSQNNSLAVPEFIKGSTDDEKKDKYASIIKRTLESSYPTQSFIGDLLSGNNTEWEKVFKSPKSDMDKFFNTNFDFDFNSENTFEYSLLSTDELKVKFKGIVKVTELVSDLQLIQRLFAFTGNFNTIVELRKKGIDSANSIVKTTKTIFIKNYKDILGGEAEASQVYNKAFKINAASLAMYGKLQPSLNTSLTVI